MKKSVFFLLSALLFCSGCTDRQLVGTYTGSMLGGIFGSSIGGLMGGYRGSDAGTVIGMVAGGVIGNAVTAPRSDGRAEEAYERRTDGDRHARQNGRSVDEYNRRTPDYGRSDVYEDPAIDGLVIENLRFVEEMRDGKLNRNERGKLVLSIRNRGNRPLFQIAPLITADDNKRILLSPPAIIAELEPGKGVRYTAAIYGDKRLKDGMATFSISVMSGNRRIVLRQFSIPTSKMDVLRR